MTDRRTIARAWASSSNSPIDQLAHLRVSLSGDDDPPGLALEPDVAADQAAPGAVPPPARDVHNRSILVRLYDARLIESPREALGSLDGLLVDDSSGADGAFWVATLVLFGASAALVRAPMERNRLNAVPLSGNDADCPRDRW